jgi:hypothetical protein
MSKPLFALFIPRYYINKGPIWVDRCGNYCALPDSILFGASNPPWSAAEDGVEVARLAASARSEYVNTTKIPIIRSLSVQCDEATPECSQCRESRRACPGPVEGLIIIAMGRGSQNQPQPPPAVGATSQLVPFSRDPQLDLASRLPPAAPSLVAGAAEQCFLGCFNSSYHTNLVKWSEQTIQNPTSPALKFAVRAGTMAFYGNLTKNVALQADASRWYSKAIQLERALVATKVARQKGKLETVNPEEIVTPMILALFESALCTSPMGWAHHCNAAAKQLEDIGPERCQTGVIFDIFRSVRLNMVSWVPILHFSRFNC